MTDEMFKNILDENLSQLSKKLQLDSGMVFQYDNELKHATHIVKH